jgi:hypothetical protein
MNRLFTYTIPVDDGAAPNPFHGMCSLAICKPAIRRVAKKGDWVAGLGSKDAPSRDLSGHVVYAMRVDEVISLKQYDERALTEWPDRIPNLRSADLAERLGDCIYDYSSGQPSQRASVHGPKNIDRDLGGENVLLSWHFYYWGAKAIELEKNLLPICHQTRGHRSDSNTPYFDEFVGWIEGLKLKPGQLYGWPDYIIDWPRNAKCGGCLRRAEDEEMQ